ncbi:MAG: hypothetical protein CBB92_08975 [Flammeovirgaceae bacterium TMED32]|nr:MAG: hypothetical protein CBB92_08975 [Flammeovirgaceae bacterium TMED32]
MKKFIIALTFSSLLFFLACDDDAETVTVTETVTETDTVTVTETDTVTVTETEIDTVTVTVIEGIEVTISSNITSDVTWSSDSVYILAGRIAVTSGATLTIEPGTIVKGEYGAGANATALLIARGGTLNAQGTASAPIIFTSVVDEVQPGGNVSPNLEPDVSGLWGGIIVLGNAPSSLGDDAAETNIEGIPTTDINGLYGGTDAADNSGTISYISIRHGGSNIGEGNEINGLTLGGVGTGTTIEGVEVVANQDDGIEWFGGTVSVSKALIWNAGDDSMDTDQDWQGTCTDYIIVTPQGGSAFELDGPEGTAKVNDVGSGYHTFSNGVVYAGADIDHVVDWDGSTNAALVGLYIFGLDSAVAAAGNSIESFGGDESGTSSAWEITLPTGVDATTVLGTSAAAITTTVAAGSRTQGPAASMFDWTWAGISGALTGIGL